MTDLEKHTKEPKFAIKASGNLSTIQQKAWVILYLRVQNTLDDKYHYAPLAEISNILEIHYDQELKEALSGLGQTTVTWNASGDDKDTKHWAMSAMLGSAEIKGNILEYEFTQKMKDLFRANPEFAQLDFPTLVTLKGKHALKLWRYCSMFKNTLTGSTGWKSVQTWRNIFGLEPSMYAQFKHFKNDVVRKAIKEINQKADFKIEAEYRKNGRIITEIRFLRKTEVKEEPKQLNDKPKKTAKIPAFRAWFDSKTRAYRDLFDANFEAKCNIDDPIERSRIYDEQIRIAMAAEQPFLDHFEA